MKKLKIINVVGARPNFMKIAPLQREMDKYPDKIIYKLVHTGQHYDKNMSDFFFQELKIKKPSYNLRIGSGSHANQTAQIMIEFEKVVIKEKPDLIIVVGDVNSTIACALTAVKLNIKVAHIEAGCRSFDRQMPEEINRVVTDSISDYLFTLDNISMKNLIHESIPKNKIFLVGDIMIDSLKFALNKIKNDNSILLKYNLKKKQYCVVTLHRPSNVDQLINLKKISNILKNVSKNIKIIFPIHPRTLKNFKKLLYNTYNNFDFYNLKLCKPLGYFDFINLISKSKFVLTDSGGIQQETTFLNIPCLTLRDTTERPLTITKGTNELVHLNMKKINFFVKQILNDTYKTSKKNKFMDGKTAGRIVKILLNHQK